MKVAAPGFNGPVEVMVRPHRIVLSPGAAPASGDLHSLSGTVHRATFAGDILEYEVEAGGTLLKTKPHTRRRAGAGAGNPRHPVWRPQDTFVYAAS